MLPTALFALCLLSAAAAAAANTSPRFEEMGGCEYLPWQLDCSYGYWTHGAFWCLNYMHYNVATATQLPVDRVSSTRHKPKEHTVRQLNLTDDLAYFVKWNDTAHLFLCNKTKPRCLDHEVLNREHTNVKCERVKYDPHSTMINWQMRDLTMREPLQYPDNHNLMRAYSWEKGAPYERPYGYRETNNKQFFMTRFGYGMELLWCTEEKPTQECQTPVQPPNGTFTTLQPTTLTTNPAKAQSVPTTPWDKLPVGHCKNMPWPARDSEGQAVPMLYEQNGYEFATFRHKRGLNYGAIPGQFASMYMFNNASRGDIPVVTPHTSLYLKFNSSITAYWCDFKPQGACREDEEAVVEEMDIQCRSVDDWRLGLYIYNDTFFEMESQGYDQLYRTYMWDRTQDLKHNAYYRLTNETWFFMVQYTDAARLRWCRVVPPRPACPPTTTTTATTTTVPLTTTTFPTQTTLNETLATITSALNLTALNETLATSTTTTRNVTLSAPTRTLSVTTTTTGTETLSTLPETPAPSTAPVYSTAGLSSSSSTAQSVNASRDNETTVAAMPTAAGRVGAAAADAETCDQDNVLFVLMIVSWSVALALGFFWVLRKRTLAKRQRRVVIPEEVLLSARADVGV